MAINEELWGVTSTNKRAQHQDSEQSKRQRISEDKPEDGNKEVPQYVVPFTSEELAAEKEAGRMPKRKVAVLIGYSGTGYKGMQIMPSEKTIEGDLFAAFVKAGAISKANADDPKKSSLVRCARTDKGVHAAGNVISLKLIIEDPDIVAKINAELTPQIRVWAIERTKGSFSCYQSCDSRWYEYLIPTHCFLPPHPSSHIGKNLVELAEEVGDLDAYKERQKEVADFWPTVDAEHVKPILEGLDERTRALVEKALYLDVDDSSNMAEGWNADAMVGAEEGDVEEGEGEDGGNSRNKKQNNRGGKNVQQQASATDAVLGTDPMAIDETSADPDMENAKKEVEEDPAIQEAIRSIKAAYSTAKHDYRISPERLDKVKKVFAKYVGTHNFHNYTVRKSPRDPSAKRHIKSFTVNPTPIIINNTEWLSLKVHGQSFMMHQIRKMVGMASLLVRCGTPLERLDESMSEKVFSIPKVPGLGLLLERPVFDNYNSQAKDLQDQRESIDFSKYDETIEEFKRREIYDRMFREEAEGNVFHAFFSHIDNFKDPTFLFLTSKGFAASNSKARAVPELPVPVGRQVKKDQAIERRRKWEATHDRSRQDADANKPDPTTLPTLAGVGPGVDKADQADWDHARVAPYEKATLEENKSNAGPAEARVAGSSTNGANEVAPETSSIGVPDSVPAVSSEKAATPAGEGASTELKTGVEERIQQDN